jgi:hypothetical protein
MLGSEIYWRGYSGVAPCILRFAGWDTTMDGDSLTLIFITELSFLGGWAAICWHVFVATHDLTHVIYEIPVLEIFG